MRGHYEHSLQWQRTWSLQEGGRQMHEISALRMNNASLKESLNKAMASNTELQQQLDAAISENSNLAETNLLPTPLRFKHFNQEGSFLKNHCKAFFPFPNMESVNLLLEAINVKMDLDDRGRADGGVCSRLRRRRYVVQLKKSGATTTVTNNNNNNNNGDNPNTDGGQQPLVKFLASSASGVGGRPRSLDWKDEFLIYCLYHYGNMNVKQIKALTQASGINELLHTWADYLDIVYTKTFPADHDLCLLHDEETSTRRYPPEESLIETFLNRQKGGAEKLRKSNDNHNDNNHQASAVSRNTLQFGLFSPQDADLVDEKITPTLFSPLCNHLREMKNNAKNKGRVSKDAEE